MRTRRDADTDRGEAVLAEEMGNWVSSAPPAKPKEAARRDFNDVLAKHREALKDALSKLTLNA